MNYEQEINKLKAQVKNLQESFLQAQKNQTPITANVDDSANKVEALTPYRETKTCYIGDTEVTFTGVPSGCMSIFMNRAIIYSIMYNENEVQVNFEPLEEVVQITISVS